MLAGGEVLKCAGCDGSLREGGRAAALSQGWAVLGGRRRSSGWSHPGHFSRSLSDAAPGSSLGSGSLEVARCLRCRCCPGGLTHVPTLAQEKRAPGTSIYGRAGSQRCDSAVSPPGLGPGRDALRFRGQGWRSLSHGSLQNFRGVSRFSTQKSF